MVLEGAQLAGVDVSRETLDRLHAYEALVRRWNPTVNLIAPGTLEHIWTRHVADSAQLFRYCPDAARHWVDLGSGGGFPGMVIGVLAAELQPELRVTLVESDRRKAAFLRQAVLKLGVRASVLAERIESLDPLAADVISARALAPLDRLLGLARPHLKPGGLALFPKGARYREELAAAQKSWVIDLDCAPSLHQPDASVLIIRKFERANHP
jgi:16S rRNA (guanine527-N7)-methyltransferase